MTGAGGPTPRDPKDYERQLSGGLMACAVALIGTALYSAGTFVDKVAWWALVVGFMLGALSATSLALSIYFGGLGYVGQITPGPKNPFNRQAQFTIAGFVLMVLAAGVLLLAPQTEDNADKRFDDIEKRLSELERQRPSAATASSPKDAMPTGPQTKP